MAIKRSLSRSRELVIKGTHLLLRQFAMSPELLQARRLRRSSAKAVSGTGSLVGRRILIPTMRDWASHVHLEALLGHYLRSEGASVRHLSCGGGLEICDRANSWESPPMPCHSCSKYVRNSLAAHGAEVSWLNESWGDPAWPEIDNMSLDELMSATYDSYELGKLVEVPVKWFLLFDSLSDDPLATKTYRAFLRSAKRVVVAVENEFARDRPDQVILLNGLFMFEGLIWEVCRRYGIPVVSYERAFIVDSFVFSHDRVSSYYEIDDAWSSARHQQLGEREERELDGYMKDRQFGLRTVDDYWAQVTKSQLDRSSEGKTVILFTNLVWDSAVIGMDIGFSSILDWVETTVREFEQLPEHTLVIRIHPAETKLSGRESREQMIEALAKRIPVFPSNVTVIPPEENTSTYELMQEADIGLVYSSTTGLEMAMLGKPVVVAARTHYRGKGFTIDVSSKDEFVAALNQLLSTAVIDESIAVLARRYAHLFFFRTPYFELGISEPMRGLVKFNSTSFEELRHGGRGDVGRFLGAVSSGKSFENDGRN